MRANRVPGSRAWGALIGVWIIASVPAAAQAGGEGELLAPPSRALPGLWRVGLAEEHEPGVAATAASGYGYTEDVLGVSDAHHRARAGVAVSYRPNSWLGLAAGFDARYDRHTGDGIDDSGYVGDPRVTARLVRPAPGAALRFGGEATLWLPGDDAPSIVTDAASLDAVALGSYAPAAWGAHALHANLGARLGRSAASAPDADRLSLAQRLALGVSESPAVLVGAGWSAQLAPATVFAEWSWDVHVGAAAPPPHQSPMRLGAGIHRRITGRYQIFGYAEVALSARPGVDRGDPLVPVEPRASLFAGVSYQIGGGTGESVPAAPAPGSVEGRVVTADGGAVADVRVRVRAGGAEAEVQTAADGSFRVADVPAGEVGIAVRAPGYRERSVATSVEARATTRVEIDLERDLPDGEIKGLVLSFDGDPVAASIRIEPIGLALTAGDDGSFSAALPPGDYEVVIAAPGHRNQRRSVTVEEQGVTVLNIDMRREL